MSRETTEEATLAVPASPTASRRTRRPRRTAPMPVKTKTGTAKIEAAPHARKAKAAWQILLLAVERIDANPYQPRLAFDPLEMEDLTNSVKEHGVQQPIIVRTLPLEPENAKQKVGQEEEVVDTRNSHSARTRFQAVRYQLVTGERRLRACRAAGRKFIPAILRDDLSNVQVAELALLENVQRSNLTVIEEAKGYKRLMIEFRLKEERIARKVGKSVQTIKDTLKLLALPDEVQTLLSEKKLTASHGQALLSLAPFKDVCLMVARHAATTPLTAASLAAAPLPNAALLKQKRLVVELDGRTRFDWNSECANCPHHAYLRSGHSFFCLQPDEWKKKQTLAIERQKQEAAQVLEEAKRQGTNTVETEKLEPASYRDLTYLSLPAGCSARCVCRGEAVDPVDPTRRVPICLDPSRLNELKAAEQQALEDARQRRATSMWNEAKTRLEVEVSLGGLEGNGIDGTGGTDGNEGSRIAALLALPVVKGRRMGFFGDPDDWKEMVQQVGKELGLLLPWDELFDPETGAAREFALLTAMEPVQLLLLSACLLLAQEASQVIRFGGDAPALNFVLGHDRVRQLELETGESEAGEEHDEERDSENSNEEQPATGGEGEDDTDIFTREGLEDTGEEDEEPDEIGASDFLTAGYQHGELDEPDEDAAEDDKLLGDAGDFEPDGYKRRDLATEREYSQDETTEEPTDEAQPASEEGEDTSEAESQEESTLVTAR